jgi:2-aminoethylphosphonate-pyruvate transaminase
MIEKSIAPSARDKLLFTPGPLTTSRTVKEAMLQDLGSRDSAFIDIVQDARERLLALAGLSKARGYEAVLMQGSGTFGLEALVTSVIPPDGKLLVIVNGAYGRRIAKIASIHRIPLACLEYPENRVPDPGEIRAFLERDPSVTHVAVVHLETTSGIMNPIDAIGDAVKEQGRTFCVDSMSAFGAVPFDFEACGVDYLVSSSNKCIEGVPGFSFVLCRRDALVRTKGYARTLSLDLYDQWQGLETNGQFRFTPPTHAVLAFRQALRELEEEGGVEGRAARYRANHRCLIEGMREIGFQTYLPPALQGYIITSFKYPEHPCFDFSDLYERLHRKGFVIYPGKVSNDDCFRIGSIGRLTSSDMRSLLFTMSEALHEMDVVLTPEM